MSVCTVCLYKYCKYEQRNVYVKGCKYNISIVSSVSVRPVNIIKKKRLIFVIKTSQFCFGTDSLADLLTD